jgi:hypothetical protein
MKKSSVGAYNAAGDPVAACKIECISSEGKKHVVKNNAGDKEVVIPVGVTAHGPQRSPGDACEELVQQTISGLNSETIQPNGESLDE